MSFQLCLCSVATSNVIFNFIMVSFFPPLLSWSVLFHFFSIYFCCFYNLFIEIIYFCFSPLMRYVYNLFETIVNYLYTYSSDEKFSLVWTLSFFFFHCVFVSFAYIVVWFLSINHWMKPAIYWMNYGVGKWIRSAHNSNLNFRI